MKNSHDYRMCNLIIISYIQEFFKHLKVEIFPGEKKIKGVTQKVLHLNSYMTTYKRAAVLNTIKKHIENLIKGVTDVRNNF